MGKTKKTDLLWTSWVRKYPGQYIAVMNGKVLAKGKSRLLAFKKAESLIAKDKEIGIFYIPTPNQYPMLLHAFSLSDN